MHGILVASLEKLCQKLRSRVDILFAPLVACAVFSSKQLRGTMEGVKVAGGMGKGQKIVLSCRNVEGMGYLQLSGDAC